MEEPRAGDILAELDKLGVLRGIHPLFAWPYPAGRAIVLDAEQRTREERRNAALSVIAAEFAGAEDDAEGLGRWLHLPAPMLKLMRDAARLVGLWQRLGDEEQSPSTTYRLLQDIDNSAIEAVMHIGPLMQDTVSMGRLRDYLDRLRHIRPQLDGSYLRLLGVPPGPIYRRVLDALLDACLDGKVKGNEAEEAFVLDRLASEGWNKK
jgi:tRNA nucleotidyltransferase/poly(A) polymerase